MQRATHLRARRRVAALVLLAATTCAPGQPRAASRPAAEVAPPSSDAPLLPRLTVDIVAAPGYDRPLLRRLLARRRAAVLACYREAAAARGAALAADFDARFAIARTNRVVDREITLLRGAAELRPCAARLLAGDLPSNCKGPARVDVTLRVGFAPAAAVVTEATP